MLDDDSSDDEAQAAPTRSRRDGNTVTVTGNRTTESDLLKGPWDLQLFSQYVAYVKHTFHPVMSNPAKQLLVRIRILQYC